MGYDAEISNLPNDGPFDFYFGRGGRNGYGDGSSKDISCPALILLNKKTFIHSGLSSLLSVIYNQNELIAVILETDPPGEEMFPLQHCKLFRALELKSIIFGVRPWIT